MCIISTTVKCHQNGYMRGHHCEKFVNIHIVNGIMMDFNWRVDRDFEIFVDFYFFAIEIIRLMWKVSKNRFVYYENDSAMP